MKCQKFMRLFFSALLSSCLSLSPLTAQEAGDASPTARSMSFTVEQAVDYALKNSRTLKSADIDLEIKKRAADNSWNVLLPTVQVSGTLSRQNNIDSAIDSANASVEMANAIGQLMSAITKIPSSTTEKVKATESMHWAAVGNLGISWNLSLAYIEQMKAAKADYESGLISLQQSRRETETSVKKLFYGLLLQQENISLQKATLENARRRSVQARTNYENGQIPELVYLQANVAYENQKPEVQNAERLLKQQLDTFAFLLGLPVGTNIELVGSIDLSFINVDADELLATYGGQNLAAQSLASSLNLMQKNLNALNLSSFTPALALNWGLQPMISDAFNKSWFERDNWSDQGSFSATLAWNITNMLPFSANRQQAKDLEANMRKLQVSMETVQENQRMEVIKAVDTLNSAREQIAAMARNIDLAQRSYNMTERAYLAGATELLELRDAETQLYQAQLGLANQKFTYISALIDLENTLNVTLSK